MQSNLFTFVLRFFSIKLFSFSFFSFYWDNLISILNWVGRFKSNRLTNQSRIITFFAFFTFMKISAVVVMLFLVTFFLFVFAVMFFFVVMSFFTFFFATNSIRFCSVRHNKFHLVFVSGISSTLTHVRLCILFQLFRLSLRALRRNDVRRRLFPIRACVMQPCRDRDRPHDMRSPSQSHKSMHQTKKIDATFSMSIRRYFFPAENCRTHQMNRLDQCLNGKIKCQTASIDDKFICIYNSLGANIRFVKFAWIGPPSMLRFFSVPFACRFLSSVEWASSQFSYFVVSHSFNRKCLFILKWKKQTRKKIVQFQSKSIFFECKFLHRHRTHFMQTIENWSLNVSATDRMNEQNQLEVWHELLAHWNRMDTSKRIEPRKFFSAKKKRKQKKNCRRAQIKNNEKTLKRALKSTNDHWSISRKAESNQNASLILLVVRVSVLFFSFLLWFRCRRSKTNIAIAYNLVSAVHLNRDKSQKWFTKCKNRFVTNRRIVESRTSERANARTTTTTKTKIEEWFWIFAVSRQTKSHIDGDDDDGDDIVDVKTEEKYSRQERIIQ